MPQSRAPRPARAPGPFISAAIPRPRPDSPSHPAPPPPRRPQYTSANYSSLSAHPPLVGFGLDGFWIYGRHLATDAPGYSIPLDNCGGHNHSITTAAGTETI
jgi:hypothetical protein